VGRVAVWIVECRVAIEDRGLGRDGGLFEGEAERAGLTSGLDRPSSTRFSVDLHCCPWCGALPRPELDRASKRAPSCSLAKTSTCHFRDLLDKIVARFQLISHNPWWYTFTSIHLHRLCPTLLLLLNRLSSPGRRSPISTRRRERPSSDARTCTSPPRFLGLRCSRPFYLLPASRNPSCRRPSA